MGGAYEAHDYNVIRVISTNHVVLTNNQSTPMFDFYTLIRTHEAQ